MDKITLIEEARRELALLPQITAAIAYGSWLYNLHSVDIDIAVIVESDDGVIEPETYVLLRDLRSKLSKRWEADVDLIPHTEDELFDHRAPLWYPRYNPSLVFGKTLKGNPQLPTVSVNETVFDFSDLTAYVLHDNRTICRRQLLRSLDGEAGRIYVSKLLHGLGNALTYRACQTRRPYICSPSDLASCAKHFDILYGTDTSAVLNILQRGANDYESAQLLMTWYETLFNLVLKDSQNVSIYQKACDAILIKHNRE